MTRRKKVKEPVQEFVLHDILLTDGGKFTELDIIEPDEGEPLATETPWNSYRRTYYRYQSSGAARTKPADFIKNLNSDGFKLLNEDGELHLIREVERYDWDNTEYIKMEKRRKRKSDRVEKALPLIIPHEGQQSLFFISSGHVPMRSGFMANDLISNKKTKKKDEEPTTTKTYIVKSVASSIFDEEEDEQETDGNI